MRPLAYAVLAAAGLLAGCGTTGTAPSDHARSACETYDRVTRHPVATTGDQWTAMTDLARADAAAAAAFDPRWADLGRDVGRSLDLRAAQDDGFLDADRRVQDDCAGAGHDIGDLEP